MAEKLKTTINAYGMIKAKLTSLGRPDLTAWVEKNTSAGAAVVTITVDSTDPVAAEVAKSLVNHGIGGRTREAIDRFRALCAGEKLPERAPTPPEGTPLPTITTIALPADAAKAMSQIEEKMAEKLTAPVPVATTVTVTPEMAQKWIDESATAAPAPEAPKVEAPKPTPKAEQTSPVLTGAQVEIPEPFVSWRESIGKLAADLGIEVNGRRKKEKAEEPAGGAP